MADAPAPAKLTINGNAARSCDAVAAPNTTAYNLCRQPGFYRAVYRGSAPDQQELPPPLLSQHQRLSACLSTPSTSTELDAGPEHVGNPGRKESRGFQRAYPKLQYSLKLRLSHNLFSWPTRHCCRVGIQGSQSLSWDDSPAATAVVVSDAFRQHSFVQPPTLKPGQIFHMGEDPHS